MTYPPPSLHGSPGPIDPLTAPLSSFAFPSLPSLPPAEPELSELPDLLESDPLAETPPPPFPASARHASRQRMSGAQIAVVAFAAACLAGVGLGLFVPEGGHSAWHAVHAWGGLALVCACLTFVPAVAFEFHLPDRHAWQVAAAGAAGLGLYWVLFVLPEIDRNTSLASTLGVAAGIAAAWFAPGRDARERTPETTGSN